MPPSSVHLQDFRIQRKPGEDIYFCKWRTGLQPDRIRMGAQAASICRMLQNLGLEDIPHQSVGECAHRGRAITCYQEIRFKGRQVAFLELWLGGFTVGGAVQLCGYFVFGC